MSIVTAVPDLSDPLIRVMGPPLQRSWRGKAMEEP
jgi:hypothetical protein